MISVTKQEPEGENQIAQCRQESRVASPISLESTKESIKKTQSISNVFESCLQTSSTFCEVSVKETDTLRHEMHENATHQIVSSVSSIARKPFNNYSQSPDILKPKPCVGLDLVAHSMGIKKSEIETSKEPPPLTSALKSEKKLGEYKTVRIMFPPQVIITSDESEVIENESGTRTQPDGHAEAVATNEFEEVVETKQTPITERNLDGVLDSISHDLDYLLNRSESFELETSTIGKRTSKLAAASVVTEIPEEFVTEECNFGAEGIVLRTNC